MFGSQVLETAIGLAVMFFILATAASAATEVVSRLMKKRSGDLEKTLLDMLSQASDARGMKRKGSRAATAKTRADAVPFLTLLKRTSIWQAAEAAAGRSLFLRKPVGNSYLSAKAFAEAVNETLISALPKNSDGDIELTTVDAVNAINDITEVLPESLQKRLDVLVGEAQHGLLDVKAGLESWYDETMARAEGAYKRWASLILFLVGLAFAVLGNVSTIDVARDLWHDSTTRTAVADAATTLVENQPQVAGEDSAQTDSEDPAEINTAGTNTAETDSGEADTADAEEFDPDTNNDNFISVDEAIEAMADVSLPIGWDQASWDEFFDGANFWWSVLTVLGWLVTALLVMLGGPFWFDLLTKLVTLRGAGKKPRTAAADDTSATSAVLAAATVTPAATPYPTTEIARDDKAAQAAARESELAPLKAVLNKKRGGAVAGRSTPTRLIIPAEIHGWRKTLADLLLRGFAKVTQQKPQDITAAAQNATPATSASSGGDLPEPAEEGDGQGAQDDQRV